jgi:hypothetical protein
VHAFENHNKEGNNIRINNGCNPKNNSNANQTIILLCVEFYSSSRILGAGEKREKNSVWE